MKWIELIKEADGKKAGEFVHCEDATADAYVAAGLARLAPDGPEKAMLAKAQAEYVTEFQEFLKRQEETLRVQTTALKRPGTITPGESEAEKKNPRSHGGMYRSILIALSTRDPAEFETHHNRLMASWDDGGFGCQRAMAEGDGTTGGYLTQTIYEAELFRFAAEVNPFTSRCREIPMPGRTVIYPALDQYQAPTAGNSALYAGVRVYRKVENTTRTETEPKVAQIELVSNDLTAYTEVGRDLMADAPQVNALIPELIGGAIGFREGFEILRGTGSGQFLGILNAPATLVRGNDGTGLLRAAGAGSTAISYGDLVRMKTRHMRMMPSNPAWFFHPFQEEQLMEMTDASGRLIYMPWWPGASGGPATAESPGRLLGLPVVFWEGMAAPGSLGDCGLFDVNKYLLGRRSGVEIALSEHFRFDADVVAIRAKTRNDGQPWAKGPFILADTAGTNKVSPFIVLGA